MLRFDEVWIVPCGARPDKIHLNAPATRLTMLQMAVKDFFPPNFPVKVDTTEVDNGLQIPTIYLLDQLMARYTENSFHFVMGSDLVQSLHWWDEGPRLINDTKFIIYERAGYDQAAIKQHENYPKNDPIVVPKAECLIGMISSTEIRRRVN
jgi:nicotinate (nicotinamide) nucleotide adenylyltransferase